jgi:hypothetical protein
VTRVAFRRGELEIPPSFSEAAVELAQF